MMKTLKQYQEKALKKLIDRTKELFEDKKDKTTIVFQSPTGSGKTFMMSHYIKEVINEFSSNDLCFLWISIGAGSLHKQSYYSLKKSFNGFPTVHMLEDEFHGGRSHINKNEVVIVNWDKINQKDKKTGAWSNVLMKDSETNNFRDVVQNTRALGTKIIMIIDESHTSAKSERALELRDEIIKANLTIEMSATPVISDFSERVSVDAQDVIDEGMIKKEIIVNENLNKYSDGDIGSIELLLKSAYSKRHELAKLYQDEDVDVNPLCLIQIPNGEDGDSKQEAVELQLATYGATKENGKLAVWLSEDKINLEMLNDNQNKVEFLIFKQAIATGWDCPRAQILVKFRDTKSETLEIQTVGRILRMPDGVHYQNDNLNKAFMYIDTNEFSVKKEEYNPNVIKSIYSTRKETYGDLKLKSYYLNRIDYGDITSGVWGDLEKTFCEYFGLKIGTYELIDENKKLVQKKISFEKSTLKNELILDEHLDTKEFDQLYKKMITSEEHVKLKYTGEDYENLLTYLIKTNLNGFAQKRSMSPVLSALRKWFALYLGISASKAENGHVIIRDIVLSNYMVFATLLDKTTKIYKTTKQKEIEAKIESIEEWNQDWEIAQTRAFNQETYKKYDFKLSLYAPCYLSFDSGLEEQFIQFLEKYEGKITWWWQNGSEHMSLNFGIKYNTKSTFQPDFIVMMNDGRVGIFDTKASGFNEDDNKLKGEALQAYIAEENKRGKKLFGGLVIKEGEHFRVNQKSEYKTFNESHDDWDYLEMI